MCKKSRIENIHFVFFIVVIFYELNYCCKRLNEMECIVLVVPENKKAFQPQKNYLC